MAERRRMNAIWRSTSGSLFQWIHLPLNIKHIAKCRRTWLVRCEWFRAIHPPSAAISRQRCDKTLQSHISFHCSFRLLIFWRSFFQTDITNLFIIIRIIISNNIPSISLLVVWLTSFVGEQPPTPMLHINYLNWCCCGCWAIKSEFEERRKSRGKNFQLRSNAAGPSFLLLDPV